MANTTTKKIEEIATVIKLDGRYAQILKIENGTVYANDLVTCALIEVAIEDAVFILPKNARRISR